MEVKSTNSSLGNQPHKPLRSPPAGGEPARGAPPTTTTTRGAIPRVGRLPPASPSAARLGRWRPAASASTSPTRCRAAAGTRSKRTGRPAPAAAPTRPAWPRSPPPLLLLRASAPAPLPAAGPRSASAQPPPPRPGPARRGRPLRAAPAARGRPPGGVGLRGGPRCRHFVPCFVWDLVSLRKVWVNAQRRWDLPHVCAQRAGGF